MKQAALCIGLFLVFAPTFAYAKTPSCSEKGYTIVFVNGIFGTRDKAQADADKLQKTLSFSYKSEPITVHVGYNPTHLAGVADLAQSTAQMFSGNISNFDRDTILLQIYPEVNTRKLILVGHSQGAFYTNEMYTYLLEHGEPIESVSVYNVGSPASYTAGANTGSTYLNSSNDALLAFLRTMNFTILPNNIDIAVDTSPDGWQGHGFSDTYLAGASERMVGDLHVEMKTLVPVYSSEKRYCFTPPDASAGYKTQQVLFTVADPTATVVKFGLVTTYGAAALALRTTAALAVGAIQFVADTVKLSIAPPSDAQATQKTNTIANKLYGSSLDSLSAQEKKELLGNSQGGAAVLALSQKKPASISTGLVEGTSTNVSNISTTTASTAPAPAPFIAQPSLSYGGGTYSAPEPAPVVDEVASNTPDNAIATEEATSTEEATTEETELEPTPPPPPIIIDEASTTPELPVLPTGAPVTDNFDTYDGSGWSVWPTPYNTIILFGADDGTKDPFRDATTTASDCHSGGCIIAIGSAGGFATFGYQSVMYKESGVGQDSGAFTIWARTRTGWRDVAASVGLCAGVSLGCTSPNNYWFNPLGLNDDTWHQYYVAWRQGGASIETCVLQDDTNSSDCAWNPINFPLGTQFDGLLLSGGIARPDLGDQVWFDDLAEASPPPPPAIVINEIEWAGDSVDSGREWIELKNLSAESIDLSHLAIVATEGGTQYIPLSGTIGPLGFFVVQRDLAAPLPSGYVQVTSFDQLDDAGEQLALVQVGDWGTTTLDNTPSVSACNGWCAGKTSATSGLNATLSMERVDAAVAGNIATNWASNDTYTASANMPGGNGQVLYATVLAENSQHILEDFGWFCAPDIHPMSIGQAYHPPTSATCTYLARFIPWQTNIMSGLFKGTVGSSTPLFIHNSWIGTSAQFEEGIDPTTESGEEFFAAVWAVRTDTYPQPLDNYTFPLYLTTGHRWARDGFGGPLVDTGDTNPPHDIFRIVPFTYTP